MSDLITITVGGINPAEIELEGSSVVTISGGSTKIDIIEIDPAEIEIEGVYAVSVSGSSVELILDSPAEIEIEGGGTFTIGAEITVSPAAIEIEGIAPLVSHLVSVLPADVEIDGVPAVSVSGSSCELVLETPADVEIKGIAPVVFIYENYSITFQPASIYISGVPAVSIGAEITVNPADVEIDGTPAQYVRNISAFELFLMTMPANYPAVTLYRCYLTGSPDLYLPISSFQARLRNGEPTYLEVVVPNAPAYIDEIAARSTGDIVVEKGLQYYGGTSDFIEIARVDFELAPYDFGAVNKTIRLSGHKTITYSTPKTVALLSVSVESLQADGKRRIRAAVDFLARPGDTVTWNDGDDSIVVGFITLTVSVLQQIMDITEA